MENKHSEKSGDVSFKVAIGAIIFATAIANMFMSKRMQSFKNLRYPFHSWSATKASHTAQNPKVPPPNSGAPGVRVSVISESNIKVLTALNLPSKSLPSVLELKAAYRLFALKNHPDVSLSDTNKMFREITLQYKELLQHLENAEDKL